MPAEWAQHKSVWLAWPSHKSLWRENLEIAQTEFIELCKEISKSEAIEMLVPNSEILQIAKKALGPLNITFHQIPFGDIWLRDTAPLFLKADAAKTIAMCFMFNGWGDKYDLPYDRQVAKDIADASKYKTLNTPFVLEGGSIDVDGEGTLLTTEQCLLNPNRNPGFSKSDIESILAQTLSIKKILWLKSGLLNDHTDGHIDTIARFTAPGEVVCMAPSGQDDPNAEVYAEIFADLKQMTDAQGQRLKVTQIPSPGLIKDQEGEIMPASFVNFYISNGSVIVPTYESKYDHDAVSAIAQLFPHRKTIGLKSRAILSGGGSFHCISQQEPI